MAVGLSPPWLGAIAAAVAPSRKTAVLWATLALAILVAAYLCHASRALSYFLAALAGLGVGATVVSRFTAQRADARACANPTCR